MEHELLCFLTLRHGPWSVRIDKQLGDGRVHKRHVHVVRKGVDGEYSWNIDGTRHDKGNFPNSEPQIQKAKELAADALGIPVDVLQFITAESGGLTVTVYALVNSAPADVSISKFQIPKQCVAILLGALNGGVMLIVARA